MSDEKTAETKCSVSEGHRFEHGRCIWCDAEDSVIHPLESTRNRSDTDRMCITCGKLGGSCRWADDAEGCMRKQLDHWRLVARECCDAIRDQDDTAALRMLKVALNG